MHRTATESDEKYWCSETLTLTEPKAETTALLSRTKPTFSEPKTERSRRAVPLNPAVVAMLRRHSAAQKQDRLRAGSKSVDSGLVFINEFGSPVEPRNLLRVIANAAKAAGVEGIGVHTLRNSAAVAWLEAGVHIKAVADLLGIRRSPSRATSTGTRPTTRPGLPSTGWRSGSGCEPY